VTTRRPLLISVDVGGTLGAADGPGLTMRLAGASPLAPDHAREIMRGRLHTEAAITETVVADVCDALRIPVSAALFNTPPTPLTLFPGTLEALRALSAIAAVVTLSNVTCVDTDTDSLRNRLAPWVSEHFPSCHIGYAKPDPLAFHAVTRHCNVASARMLHIGDDWACDVVGAVNAGARAIWVSQGRPVPDQAMLARHEVLVAYNLTAAARFLTQR
jgi:FMN hydrolase / 5-amino-6-(5-phospho-D-ribitylamino)uracil phosphatase